MLTATSQCIRFGVTVTVTSITVFPATQHLYYPTLRMSPQPLTHTSQIPILLQWSYDRWKTHCFHWSERWDPCCWPIPLQIHFRFLHPLLHMTMYESEAWRGQGAVVRGNRTWTMTVGRLSGTPREVTELRRMEKSGCGDQATTSPWLHEEGGTAHTGVLLCVGTGNAGCALCSETTNRQQCFMVGTSALYCQASGGRIQTMGMKLRLTGHSSQWGHSLPQDRQKSNMMGHKQIMRFLQCPGRFSDVYVGWTDDGRCWTEVGLDEWATGEGNLVHIELAFWHFIANCQQALCIYYRKQHIPTE